MKHNFNWKLAAVATSVFWGMTLIPVFAQQPRTLGLDVSTWQGNLSTNTWAIFKRATNQEVNGVFGDSRDFVFIRSSRGGTTGEDHRQGGYSAGNNTYYTNSQRYDDPYFVQNINNATAAGLFAGPYHFGRHDIIATTLNSGGIANTGADEADHMIQMAGAWMRPGYILPVFDLEGPNNRTTAGLAAFCMEFSDRIHQVMGIRPIMYINGGYCTTLQSYTDPAALVAAFPRVWVARYTSNNDPTSTAYLTGHPKDSFSGFYGPWDDAPNPTHPWSFWQYSSQGGLNGYANNIDKNAAQGGIEFVKDHLVPALWMTDTDGQWTDLANWNSGQIPVPPATGAGQLGPYGEQTLPTPRLPASNDTVIIERLDITVTLASGAHDIRKLYMRNILNITGGSLNINYVPSWNSTTNAAEFSGPVTLSGGANLSVHTLQVDAGNIFTLAGGTLTFNSINLMPDSFSPANLVVTGDMNFNPLSDATATISGIVSEMRLGGANRNFNVGDGAAEVDLSVDVALSDGGFTKIGAGTMRLTASGSYAWGTTISEGTLLHHPFGISAAGSGPVTINGGRLIGYGHIFGKVTVNNGGTFSPGESINTLTLHSPPIFNGTTVMEIDRNDGVSLADKIILLDGNGTMNYGGTLVVTNVGAPLVGGEIFTNFAADAFTGAFANTILPPLTNGLNWHLGNLITNGSIKVNRCPVANPVTFTNDAPQVLQIPYASLLSNGTDLDGDSLTVISFSPTTTNGITLVSSNAIIYYSNYVSVVDRFDYVISDGHGGSATGVVQIASNPTGRITSQANVNSASTTLHFVGAPGWTYYVDRSTNLPAWLPIWTNVAPANGVFEFTDNFLELSEPPSSSFYRLRWAH